MSDTIDAAAPTLTESAGKPVLTGPADAAADHLRPCDLTRLAQGFYFIFWGSLAVLSTMAEALGAPTLRLYSIMIGGAGALGMLAGSWRLYQTKDLGRDWKSLTHGLLIVAMFAAYLFPFFCMWRGVPVNLYLLCHALAWIGTLICYMSLLSVAIGAFAKLAGRSSLALQALLYGIFVFIALFTPFVLLAWALIHTTHHGADPLVAVQLLLGSMPPVYILMAMIPFSLTLSLAWTAKDMALRRLTAPDSQETGDSEST
jgi:hypothetical protein